MTGIKDHHPTARRPHRCEECGRFIPVGTRYHYYFGTWEGETFINRACERCSALRVRVNKFDHDYYEDYYNGLDSWIGGEMWREVGEPDIGLLREIAGFRHQWVTAQGNPWPRTPEEESND